MDKVTYFDVEYANPKNKAICQIGVVCENYNDQEPYFPELNVYINPEDGFATNCVRVHGITASKVANEPAFPKIWENIEKYFTNSVVIGHNVASSDLDALVKNLRRYNLDIPEFYYICTYELARRFVPSYAVPNYSLATLCEYFEIDIDFEHNAFDDACACADLFRSLVETYDIDVDEYVKKYYPNNETAHTSYIDGAVLRKSISEFYGMVRGFSIDSVINQEEMDYIATWRDDHIQYSNHKEIRDIVEVIDDILDDNIITLDEITLLQRTMKEYLEDVSTSPVTLATQILDGILRGITVDGEISTEECKSLRQWLYDNIYLSDHFPFNKAIEIVDQILEDSTVTKEESEYLTTVIENMLNPVEFLKAEIYSVEGKHICLSGVFEYGSKTDVQTYICERGGFIDTNV